MAKQTFTTGQVLTAAQMTDLQQTAMTGGAASTKTVSYVLVPADAGTRVAMNAAGSTTITVNTGLFSAGDTVSIQNIGAGVCTVTAGTATVNTSGSLVLAQYQGGILYFTSASAAIFFQYATPESGDITAVTAGTGISGGGTSGAVTITNSMATEITAAGDIVVGTGNATFDNLPIGSTGQVLTADTTVSPYKVKWATPTTGAMTLLSTTSLSGSSTVTFGSGGTLSQDYNEIWIYMEDFYNNGASTNMGLRFNGDTGSNYISAGARATSGANNAQVNATTVAYTYTSLRNAQHDACMVLRIPNYTDTSSRKQFSWQYGIENGTPVVEVGWGTGHWYNSTPAAITSISLVASSNFDAGTALVYGVK